jgi:hypothetical protein
MSRDRKPAVGAQPGTLAIDPMASKPVIRVFCYDEENLLIVTRMVEEIEDSRLDVEQVSLLVGANQSVTGDNRPLLWGVIHEI